MIDDDLFDIVRKLDGWPGTVDDRSVLVVLDGRGRPVDDDPRLAWMKNRLPRLDRHIYEIRTSKAVEIWDSHDTIRPFSTNQTVSIPFRLRLWAKKDDAPAIAAALHDHSESPSQRLFRHLREILRSLVDEEARKAGIAHVGNWILGDRPTWQARIAADLHRATGLTVEIEFELTRESETLEFALEAYPVSPSDAPHMTVPLTVHVRLKPTARPADTVTSLPATNEKRRDLLARLVGEAARRHVTLHALWYDLPKAAGALRTALAEDFVLYGCEVDDLRIGAPRPPLPEVEPIDVALPWKGARDREVIFHLDARMCLTEKGAGIYHAGGLEDRRAWLLRHANAALRLAMQKRDFYDLTPEEQEKVADSVRRSLAGDALVIGHRIEPVTHDVRLPEKRWLSTQIVPIAGRLFATKDANVRAEFSASVEIRFPQIRPLIEHIDHGAAPRSTGDYNDAIETAIRTLAVETLTNTMKTVEARDYYHEWENWHEISDAPQVPTKGKPNFVRDTLVQAVRAVLRQRLAAGEVSVQLDRIDSELARIEDAINLLGPIAIEGIVEPRSIRKLSEQVRYHVGVHPGPIFSGEAAAVLRRGIQNIDKGRIADGVKIAVDEFLNGRTMEELNALNPGSLSKGAMIPIADELAAYINRHIVRHFGFTVTLNKSRVDRPLAEMVQLRARGYGDHEKNAILDIAYDTLDQQAKARRSAANHDQNSIERLQASILSNPLLTKEDEDRHFADTERLDAARRRQDTSWTTTETAAHQRLTRIRDEAPGEDGQAGDGTADGDDPDEVCRDRPAL